MGCRGVGGDHHLIRAIRRSFFPPNTGLHTSRQLIVCHSKTRVFFHSKAIFIVETDKAGRIPSHGVIADCNITKRMVDSREHHRNILMGIFIIAGALAHNELSILDCHITAHIVFPQLKRTACIDPTVIKCYVAVPHVLDPNRIRVSRFFSILIFFKGAASKSHRVYANCSILEPIALKCAAIKSNALHTVRNGHRLDICLIPHDHSHLSHAKSNAAERYFRCIRELQSNTFVDVSKLTRICSPSYSTNDNDINRFLAGRIDVSRCIIACPRINTPSIKRITLRYSFAVPFPILIVVSNCIITNS